MTNTIARLKGVATSLRRELAEVELSVLGIDDEIDANIAAVRAGTTKVLPDLGLIRVRLEEQAERIKDTIEYVDNAIGALTKAKEIGDR